MTFIICQLSCNNQKQTKINSVNNKTLEKFDLKKFNDKKIGNEYEYNINDTLVKLSDEGECFIKELRLNNQNYKYYFYYDKINNLLVSESSFFYEMPIGTWNEYNKEGNLIKSKNYDQNFTFTINDLILKLKSELNIDINNNTNNQFETISVRRGYNNEINRYVYYINIPINEVSSKFVMIDGKNGSILANNLAYAIE